MRFSSREPRCQAVCRGLCGSAEGHAGARPPGTGGLIQGTPLPGGMPGFVWFCRRPRRGTPTGNCRRTARLPACRPHCQMCQKVGYDLSFGTGNSQLSQLSQPEPSLQPSTSYPVSPLTIIMSSQQGLTQQFEVLKADLAAILRSNIHHSQEKRKRATNRQSVSHKLLNAIFAHVVCRLSTSPAPFEFRINVQIELNVDNVHNLTNLRFLQGGRKRSRGCRNKYMCATCGCRDYPNCMHGEEACEDCIDGASGAHKSGLDMGNPVKNPKYSVRQRRPLVIKSKSTKKYKSRALPRQSPAKAQYSQSHSSPSEAEGAVSTAKSLIVPSASDSPVHDHMEPVPVYKTAERTVSQYDPTAPQYNPTSPVYLQYSTSPKYSPTTPEPSVCDTPRCDHAPEDAPASLEEAVRTAFTSMTSTKVILSPHYSLASCQAFDRAIHIITPYRHDVLLQVMDIIHAERKKARLEGIVAYVPREAEIRRRSRCCRARLGGSRFGLQAIRRAVCKPCHKRLAVGEGAH